MLRKLLGSHHESLSSVEEVSISQLAAAHSQLQLDGDRLNTKSEAGYSACQGFLERLDNAARVVRLEPASRLYRAAFTINYRALFPDEARNYRVDVLEASVEQYAVIWVNGDKFEFSQEAMRRSEALQRAWSELGAILERWSQPDLPRGSQKATRPEIKSALTALDTAWASFENKYISELIEIEEKARSLIMQAVEYERNLASLEKQHAEEALTAMPHYHEEQQRLVAGVARLNSVANFRRKGRDDFNVAVLVDARATLIRCDSDEKDSKVNADAINAARLLATDVVESFASVRSYLREVEKCLERVDPHLCNNPGLVARLVDLEESWEIGAKYIQHPGLLNALCDLVAEIRAAGRVAPMLTQMITDCDVELFLCLPRIIWLRFLAEPVKHAELMKSLLPQRFGKPAACKPTAVSSISSPRLSPATRQPIADAAGPLTDAADAAAGASLGLSFTGRPAVPSGDDGPALDASGVSSDSPEAVSFADTELQGFLDLFQRVKIFVIAALPPNSGGSPDVRAWELIIRRVVVGTDGPGDPYASCLAEHREETSKLIEELVHELERWSMELQRHCPEDWNQCSAILVQCLEDGHQKERKTSFRT